MSGSGTAQVIRRLVEIVPGAVPSANAGPSRRAVLGGTVGTAVVTAAAVAGWPAPDAGAAVRGTVNRGAWNPRTTYGLADRVSRHGVAWIAVRSSTGVEPARAGGRWVRAA